MARYGAASPASWLTLLLLLVTTATLGHGAKRGGKDSEPVIEEVTAKQLERILNEKDYVAVFWCE